MKPMIENLLLDPVSFELTLKRNLSLSWFKELPDLEVISRLELIHVTLSHQDYCFVLRVTNENFSEGEPQAAVETSRPSSKRGQETAQIGSEKCYAVTEEKTTKQEEVQELPSSHISVKFAFSMDSFIFDAIEGGDRLVNYIFSL